jgi:O-antigen ligase
VTITDPDARPVDAVSTDPVPTDPPPPWMLRLLCFVIPALPVYVVLPGALKGNGTPVRIITLIMFGLVILGFLTRRRSGGGRTFNPGIVILLSYLTMWLVVSGMGMTAHDDFTTASNRTRSLLALAGHVAAGLYVLVSVRSARQRDVLLGWLAAGLTFACLVGLLQSVSSIDLRYLFQPPGFILNTEDLALSERMGVTRVRSTSQHAIEFSVLAAVTIPLTIYFARHATLRWVRWLSGAACVVAALALPASVSRSGIISLLAALAIYVFAFKLRPIAVASVVIAAAITGYVAAFPHVADALWRTFTGSAEDESVSGRLEDYAKVSETLSEHPIFGLGLGGAPPTVFGYLDNEWLQAVVQGGVIGLIAMTAVMIGALFGMSASMRGVTSPRQREQTYVMAAMTVGIIASSFTFDLFSFEQAALVFFLLFGLLWSGFDVAAPERRRDRHLLDRLVTSRSQLVLGRAARHRTSSATAR